MKKNNNATCMKCSLNGKCGLVVSYSQFDLMIRDTMENNPNLSLCEIITYIMPWTVFNALRKEAMEPNEKKTGK